MAPIPRPYLRPLVGALFALAACSPSSPRDADPILSIALQWDHSKPPPPVPVNDPPDSIVIRWQASAASLRYAQKEADLHCLEWNRYAQPIRTRVNAGIGEAQFVCRPPTFLE